MARVTVEDCIEKVPNRFELVMLALQRSRNLASGANPNLPRDGDKNPVIALREIAESKVDEEKLWEELTDHFHLPQEGAATVDGSDGNKLLETAPEEKIDGKTTGGAGEADIGEREMSEEDMIRALQELEGEPSP